MDRLLVVARIAHFVGELSLLGIFAFVFGIARPACRCGNERMPRWLIEPLRAGAAISLLVALLGAVVWLAFVARDLSGDTLWASVTGDSLRIVLSETQFGRVSALRLALMLALAPFIGALGRGRRSDAVGTTLVTMLVIATAWLGHAGAGTGLAGAVHLSADSAHLAAAGAWLGALLPLSFVLAQARHRAPGDDAAMAHAAATAFSDLGMACVGTLFATGVINAWFLVGSVGALIGTLYGRLLMLKVALFLLMLGLAGFNRLRLLPRLSVGKTDTGALMQIARHARVEVALGLSIVAIIGILGTLAPAIDRVAHAANAMREMPALGR